MTNHQILETVDHRPWELAKGKWSYYQEWNQVVFLHWKVSQSILRKFVPEHLEIDLYQNQAWISLVVFRMDNIRPRLLPSFPPISNFDEINIRTYVQQNGKSGVYFLSIEASKRLSTLIAKNLSELPYRYSSINRNSLSNFSSKNTNYNDHLNFTYEVKNETPKKSELDLWLTERYALFQTSRYGLNKFEIHHIEWPIKNIKLSTLKYHYSRFLELFSGEPNLVHFSEGVQVLAWAKENQNIK
ncbi:YqjF family protein [Reichenbachiella versicolor]|uniref:YqjF family protein n=1 Tax=Reichenbachiella versicolor TaxID=1821036 RepID=UPI000D6E5981|nr:DUF2071 domain-containing protein [Reichenbachiella versicolor]